LIDRQWCQGRDGSDENSSVICIHLL
jgi:hypothetical protein